MSEAGENISSDSSCFMFPANVLSFLHSHKNKNVRLTSVIHPTSWLHIRQPQSPINFSWHMGLAKAVWLRLFLPVSRREKSLVGEIRRERVLSPTASSPGTFQNAFPFEILQSTSSGRKRLFQASCCHQHGYDLLHTHRTLACIHLIVQWALFHNSNNRNSCHTTWAWLDAWFWDQDGQTSVMPLLLATEEGSWNQA